MAVYIAVGTIVRSNATSNVERDKERTISNARNVLGYTILDSGVDVAD
jgi:hypothetical protein